MMNEARCAELEWSLNAGQIGYLYCICLTIHCLGVLDKNFGRERPGV